jgi:epoxyqueuosine reductase
VKSNLSEHQLTAAIRCEARRLGFDHCRLAPVGTPPHADFFEGWLAAGCAGEMGYLARYQDKRRQPAQLLPADSPPARSLIVLAVNHHQFALPPDVRDDPSRGLVAAYAWGDDYHELIRPLLYELDGLIRHHTGRTTPAKGLVDSGPVLERDWAAQSGIGFIGKNCCLIHPTDGSWLLLATLLVPEVLVYDPPPQPQDEVHPAVAEILHGLPPAGAYGTWRFAEDGAFPLTGTCGRCTRCLTACPTRAFVGPYHLDPQRCISYWTVEAKTPIPRELRPRFGNRIFGCDICQEVCPWNQRLPERTPLLAGLHAQTNRVAPPLLEGFAAADPYWLDEAAFRMRFRRSPLLRARRAGMLRNVCVALGNWANPSGVSPLTHALADAEPLPRGHAAWALGQVVQQHSHQEALQVLRAAQARESDPWVRMEIAAALQGEP